MIITMKNCVSVLCVVLLMYPHMVYSDGTTIGKRTISFGAGYQRPGNDALRSFDSSGLTFAGGLGLPLNERIDFSGSFVHLRYSNGGADLTANSIGASILYHFETESATEPYVTAGVAVLNAEATAGIASEDQTEVGLLAALGIQSELSPQVLLDLGGSFVLVDGNTSINASGGFLFWLSNAVYLSPGVGYGFDEGDFTLTGSLGFDF